MASKASKPAAKAGGKGRAASKAAKAAKVTVKVAKGAKGGKTVGRRAASPKSETPTKDTANDAATPTSSTKFPGKAAPADAPGTPLSLRGALNSNRNGKTSSHHNVLLILQLEKAWQGVFAFDEFTSQIIKVKPPPWLPGDKPAGDQLGVWLESDAARLASWITRNHDEIRPTLQTVHDAVRVVAEANVVHPVRDWLMSLKWDGKARVDSWLIDYAGAEDTPYNRAVSAMFMLGAVARIMKPGCKVDHTLVIEGKTGKGKSTLLRELVGEQWFLETESDLGSKDFLQSLRGKWVLELAELDSLNRSELSRIKAILTKRIDTYRESYGRYARDFPRQCVFTGTTEEDQYLKDEKGNRRFFPVATGVNGDIDVRGVVQARAQLWAEAVVRFLKGEAWHVTDKKLLGLFEEEQEMRRQLDPWEKLIAKFLHGSRYVTRGCDTADVLDALGIEPGQRTRGEETRVGAILKKLGWAKTRVRVYGTLTYIYKPLDELRWRVPEKDKTPKKDPGPEPLEKLSKTLKGAEVTPITTKPRKPRQ